MKKIATLILAAAMICGASTGANAIDFKAKGQWIMNFDYGMHGNATGGNGQTGYGDGSDEFDATQRVRLQLDAVASEALSGQVFFELGPQAWGSNTRSTGGGALGADGTNVIKVRRAFIDWMVPQTDLKVRMGLQGLQLPSFTTNANSVLDDDVAGVVLSYQFNENVGLTAFWARLYNDNFAGWNGNRARGKNHDDKWMQNYMDNLDAFGLLLPLTFDGIKVTPWVMYAAIGPNTFSAGGDRWDNNAGQNVARNYNRWDNVPGASASQIKRGMFPVGGAMTKEGDQRTKRLSTYGNAIWAGLTGDISMWDPFRIAWDVEYGSVAYGDSHMNRSGWQASLLFEYKLDWAVPGLYGWYSSGDDSNPGNGSERMPYLSPTGNNQFSNYSFTGGTTYWREATLSDNMVGTWGIGARLKDMSFIEDLKHTFHINFLGGTNSPTMAKKYLSGRNTDAWTALSDGGPSAGEIGMEPVYMTTQDYALEFGLHNAYKMYENFTVMLDANYLCMMMDHSRSVWGRSKINGKDDTVMDPWNVKLSFVYDF